MSGLINDQTVSVILAAAKTKVRPLQSVYSTIIIDGSSFRE